MGKEDIIVLDKLVHACIVDAARLCGAKLRVFAHNDLNELEDILKWAQRKRASSPGDGQSVETGKGSRVLVVTESVFSMDGDHAPLWEIVELKEKFNMPLVIPLIESQAWSVCGAKNPPK